VRPKPEDRNRSSSRNVFKCCRKYWAMDKFRTSTILLIAIPHRQNPTESNMTVLFNRNNGQTNIQNSVNTCFFLRIMLNLVFDVLRCMNFFELSSFIEKTKEKSSHREISIFLLYFPIFLFHFYSSIVTETFSSICTPMTIFSSFQHYLQSMN
jgi:hypothetical protein